MKFVNAVTSVKNYLQKRPGNHSLKSLENICNLPLSPGSQMYDWVVSSPCISVDKEKGLAAFTSAVTVTTKDDLFDVLSRACQGGGCRLKEMIETSYCKPAGNNKGCVDSHPNYSRGVVDDILKLIDSRLFYQTHPSQKMCDEHQRREQHERYTANKTDLIVKNLPNTNTLIEEIYAAIAEQFQVAKINKSEIKDCQTFPHPENEAICSAIIRCGSHRAAAVLYSHYRDTLHAHCKWVPTNASGSPFSIQWTVAELREAIMHPRFLMGDKPWTHLRSIELCCDNKMFKKEGEPLPPAFSVFLSELDVRKKKVVKDFILFQLPNDNGDAAMRSMRVLRDSKEGTRILSLFHQVKVPQTLEEVIQELKKRGMRPLKVQPPPVFVEPTKRRKKRKAPEGFVHNQHMLNEEKKKKAEQKLISRKIAAEKRRQTWARKRKEREMNTALTKEERFRITAQMINEAEEKIRAKLRNDAEIANRSPFVWKATSIGKG
jgi:hypothetical protein